MNSKTESSIIARRLSQRGYLELAHAIAVRCHVTVEDMLGRSKKKSHVAARHELWHAIYADGRLSFPEIGDIVDRDNSSIVYGVKKCAAMTIANVRCNDDSVVSTAEKVA